MTASPGHTPLYKVYRYVIQIRLVCMAGSERRGREGEFARSAWNERDTRNSLLPSLRSWPHRLKWLGFDHKVFMV